MTRYLTQRRTAAIALLVGALTSGGLTACGSSSDPSGTTQARTLSPQQAAIRQAGIVEIMACARRHGIHLPPPTAAGVNVSGVKGRHNEVVMSVCYHNAVKKAESKERAIGNTAK